MNAIKTSEKSTARFDARLSQSQKKLFEEAAKIKGYKSLSEFVIQTTQEAASKIVEQHNAFLSSEKDKTIFFDSLTKPPKPNSALTKAVKHYQKHVK